MMTTPVISSHKEVKRMPLNEFAYQNFKEGDIVKMDFGNRPYSLLCGEQVGFRPVVILKTADGNSRNPLIEVVKLTTKVNKRSKWHVAIDSVPAVEGSLALIEQHGSFGRDRVTSAVLGNVGKETLDLIKSTLVKYLYE